MNSTEWKRKEHAQSQQASKKDKGRSGRKTGGHKMNALGHGEPFVPPRLSLPSSLSRTSTNPWSGVTKSAKGQCQRAKKTLLKKKKARDGRCAVSNPSIRSDTIDAIPCHSTAPHQASWAATGRIRARRQQALLRGSNQHRRHPSSTSGTGRKRNFGGVSTPHAFFFPQLALNLPHFKTTFFFFFFFHPTKKYTQKKKRRREGRKKKKKKTFFFKKKEKKKRSFLPKKKKRQRS
ncbi:hypothetical protein ACU4GA_26350 [Methylobacterium oryzae CBMB20]